MYFKDSPKRFPETVSPRVRLGASRPQLAPGPAVLCGAALGGGGVTSESWACRGQHFDGAWEEGDPGMEGRRMHGDEHQTVVRWLYIRIYIYMVFCEQNINQYILLKNVGPRGAAKHI